MNAPDLIDPVFCGRLCLTLLHSTWQIAILVFAARFWEGWRKPSAQWSYALYVGVLATGLAALPVTYLLLGDTESRVMASAPAVGASRIAERDRTLGAQLAPRTPDSLASTGRTAPSVAPASADSARFRWSEAARWGAAAYLVGVVLMLVRLIAALVAANRLGVQARPLADGPLVTAVQSLARAWSMRVAPALAETERILAPKVVGLVRPTILLPGAAVSGLSADELQLILLHELAHIRRHDMWIVLIQRLAETALFYNPVLWSLSRRISSLREYCCDDIACRAHEAPEPQLRYATALLRLVELAAPERSGRVHLAALAASGRSPSELRRRVARVLGEPIHEPLRISRGMVMAGATTALALAFSPALAPSQAQPKGQNTAAKQPAASQKEARQQNQATPKTRPAEAEAKDRFSFGGKVEILAIGTHDEDPDRWWDKDGKPLVPLPAPLVGCFVPQWDDEGKRLPSAHIVWKKRDQVSSDDPAWRRIVFRVHDLPEDAQVNWRIPAGGGSGEGEVTVEGERAPKGYFSRYFGLPADQKTASLKVGVAAGPWKKVVEAQPFGRLATGMVDGKGAIKCVVFSGGLDTAQGTVIVVSHNYFDQNFRIVAFDKQGKLRASADNGILSAGEIHQSQGRFPGVTRDDIDRFEFQTRDYEYVELKGLPLDPPAAEDKSR
jgi:beta-lactamase regulating signal transducer with metallopeptidase domain